MQVGLAQSDKVEYNLNSNEDYCNQQFIDKYKQKNGFRTL